MGQTLLLTAVLGEVIPMLALTFYASIYGHNAGRLWLIVLLFLAAIFLLRRFRQPYVWFNNVSKATTQLDIRLAFFLIFTLVTVAESVGADGILVVTPYYNKTTQAGLIEHYKTIAEAVTVPIIMYSVPSRTGVNINPETCLELSKIKNIVAIKEASGNLSQVAKIASLCRDNLDIYSGNDDQIVPILSLGGKGVISVLSNVMPRYTHDMTQKFFDGKIREATQMQLDAIDLIDALFSEVNPIPVKYALNLMGYNYGKPRLPLVELSAKNQERMRCAMKNHNLI